MPVNHANEGYPEPEEQHREYIFLLLDQRAEALMSMNHPDDADLAELAQIEDILASYHVEVEIDG